MQCRNYMEQYSRTKSIREINKNRNSYKLLTQHSKLLSSNNLIVSQKKLIDQYKSNQIQHKSSIQKQKTNNNSTHQSNNIQKQPLHASHKPNRDSFSNIRQNSCLKDLSSKMKMKTSIGQRSSKSIHSYQKGNTNALKNVAQSKKNSLKNVIYDKIINHSISITSNSKNKNHLESINETQPHTQYNTSKKGNFQEIFERMKKILQQHKKRQQQWEEQRNGYQDRIKILQRQLEQEKTCGSLLKKNQSRQNNQNKNLHSFRKC